MTRESYSNAIGDINNDGKPDIVVGNDNEAKFFMGESDNYMLIIGLKVKLEGVSSNKDGIGNSIEVNIANGQSQYRYTVCRRRIFSSEFTI